MIFIALNASQVYKEAGPRVQNKILCIFFVVFIYWGAASNLELREVLGQGLVTSKLLCIGMINPPFQLPLITLHH